MSKQRIPIYKLSSTSDQIERIFDGLRQLGLGGMQTSFVDTCQQALVNHKTNYDILQSLIELEMDWQNNDHIKRRIDKAGFPFERELADFIFSHQPSLNPEQIYECASGRFIERAENIIFSGPDGVGKTHLAVALGRAAIRKNYSVRYYTLKNLIETMKKVANEIYQSRNFYSAVFKNDLLILDDMGFHTVDEESSIFLFDLVYQRYEKHSIIFTSNTPIPEWGKVFGIEKPARASAAIGRIMHHGTEIVIDGPNQRLPSKN